MTNPTAGPVRLSARWSLVLGAVGFAAGFFGPLALNPEANTGPLVGILITGPGGAIAGAFLGALAGMLSVPQTRQLQFLVLACAALAIGTLYYCLPQPAVRGYVIDAEVEACDRPTRKLADATRIWEHAVASVTWAAPSANWQETASSNVRGDTGVVLTLGIRRKAAVLRHRRPWDANRTSAGPWVDVNESKDYYADDAGSTCAPYLARSRQWYWPAVDPDMDPTQPAQVWPPTDTLGFLQLQRLEPVPAQYQPLLH
jgi:hypothetical protein